MQTVMVPMTMMPALPSYSLGGAVELAVLFELADAVELAAAV